MGTIKKSNGIHMIPINRKLSRPQIADISGTEFSFATQEFLKSEREQAIALVNNNQPANRIVSA